MGISWELFPMAFSSHFEQSWVEAILKHWLPEILASREDLWKPISGYGVYVTTPIASIAFHSLPPICFQPWWFTLSLGFHWKISSDSLLAYLPPSFSIKFFGFPQGTFGILNIFCTPEIAILEILHPRLCNWGMGFRD